MEDSQDIWNAIKKLNEKVATLEAKIGGMEREQREDKEAEEHHKFLLERVAEGHHSLLD